MFQDIYTKEDYIIEVLFSQHALDVMTKREISKALVFDVLQTYSLKVSISDVEEHYFGEIDDAGSRCLKVVFNPKTRNVITVYFDRNMRKKGCK